MNAPPVEDAARELAGQLPAWLGSESAPLRRLDRLREFDERARPLLCALESEIEAAPLPLSHARTKSALAADNLLKAIASEYQKLVAALSAPRVQGGTVTLAPAALGLARTLARRQALACRAGRAASPTAWRHLHQVVGLARACGFDQTRKGSGSVETLYLGAVLLATTDPTRTPRQDLASTLAAIDRLAPLARLLDPAQPDRNAQHRRVLIDPHTQAPRFESGAEAGFDAVWTVDLEAVFANVHAELGLIAAGGRDPSIPRAPVPERVLVRLLEDWRGPGRRFARQSVWPRVELATGLDQIWWALSGSPAGQKAKPANRSAGGESVWGIVDESADGFGLGLLRGTRPDLEIGDLVGLRLNDGESLQVCIVRRIDQDRQQRTRLGLQRLTPKAAAIVLVDADSGQTEAAVKLSCLPARGGSAGLATRTGRFTPGTHTHQIESGAVDRLLIGAAVEDNGRHALHLIEPGASR